MKARTAFAIGVALVVVLAGPLVAALFPAEPGVKDDVGGAAVKRAAAEVYVCEPCHGPCDEKEHKGPGVCETCGMRLVKKSEVAALAQRHAAQMAADASARKQALVLIFEGVQIIDFTGPYEVLGQAGMRVATVAEKPDAITTSMGLRVTPAYTLANAPAAEVIVVPGGDVSQPQDSAAVHAFLKERAGSAQVVLSVCNGAFVLAKSGLLDGLSATTFAGLIDGLKAIAPKTNVVSDKRYVDNGKVVTTAGLSSGIDGSLHVVEKLYGKGTAQRVATNLEYNWDPAGAYVRAQLADRHLASLYRAMSAYDRELVLHEGTRDRWENRWTVKTTAPAPQVMAAIVEALSASAKPKEEAGGLTATWAFADASGAPWRGTAKVSPAPGAAGYSVVVQIAREAKG